MTEIIGQDFGNEKHTSNQSAKTQYRAKIKGIAELQPVAARRSVIVQIE